MEKLKLKGVLTNDLNVEVSLKDLFRKEEIDKVLAMRDIAHIQSRINDNIQLTVRTVKLNNIKQQLHLSEKEKRRALKIKKKLEGGFHPQPIYLHNGEIIEGKHRLIAFNWHGIEEVIQVDIEKV